MRHDEILLLFELDLHGRVLEEDGIVAFHRLERDVLYFFIARLPGLSRSRIRDSISRPRLDDMAAQDLLFFLDGRRQVEAGRGLVHSLVRIDEHSVADDDEVLLGFHRTKYT